MVKATPEGVVLDPTAQADRRTEAEKRAEAHFLKYEEQRAKKAAAKSHRERIKELNGAPLARLPIRLEGRAPQSVSLRMGAARGGARVLAHECWWSETPWPTTVGWACGDRPASQLAQGAGRPCKRRQM